MSKSIRVTPVLLVLMAGVAYLSGVADSRARDETPKAAARAVLDTAGVTGGFVVHVGCGDGKLTAALRADDRFTVQGLDSDPARVRTARESVQRLGLAGAVSFEVFDGEHLPYADNLINLVVVEPGSRVPKRELLRVLVPRGVACVRHGDQWEKRVKPWPVDLDEWSHFLHDAGNNAVAHDRRVGPPRRLQWVAPPLWLRSHETPSGVQAQISAAGRLFYIFDGGLIGITDPRIPDRWSIVCRDAFNGKLLWKRPLPHWGWREWARQRFEGKDWTTLRSARVVVPPDNECRLVADADRVYTTLGFHAPLAILDAATGKTLRIVRGTEGAAEFRAADGIVVVRIPLGPTAVEHRRGVKNPRHSRLIAVNAKSGRIAWKREVGWIPPLLLAVDRGRVVFLNNGQLAGLDLRTGKPLWHTRPRTRGVRTLVAHEGLVFLEAKNALEAHDGADGRQLWFQRITPLPSIENQDLFVANGLLWRGLLSVDEKGRPRKRSPNVLGVGRDLRSGEVKKRIMVQNFRSPEHHHRCYRNKATDRYIITSMEGFEFLDLQDGNHSQNNWVRGACRLGTMPCNGLLYAPSDQCFCEPGSKLLGYAALAASSPVRANPVFDDRRLERGAAYGSVSADQAPDSADDWPTFRHDPARHGSTRSRVPANMTRLWKRKLGGSLTPPVVAHGYVFVAAPEAHALYALDAESGELHWTFTAGGRIDSPPTVYRGLVLFGAHDGRVTCLRETDGQPVWRFLAAPRARIIGAFGQFESAWPVYGSVLVDRGVAYVAAGRSTYLDGGIRLYALDPLTGRVLHTTTISGPFPESPKHRDVSFYTLGANSDVLVSEGGFIYMRQKKFTPALDPVSPPVLSSKGEQDVGLHVFATSGLLDGSWYNRTFWMYSKRWPGFQLANQAPKTGQLLVVDDAMTWAIRVFYRRNVHSPMFFPGREGYLLFADKNTTEPQIVGEPGARPPLAWLPQSDVTVGKRVQKKLDIPSFGRDKFIGYTRADPPAWTRWLHVRIRAMVKAGDTLFVAGPPDVLDPKDPYAAFEGRKGADLVAINAANGKPLATIALGTPPVFDGMIAARNRLYLALRDGSIVCLGAARRARP